MVINNSIKDTVDCSDGDYSYSLQPKYRKYDTNKVTTVDIQFNYASSGYWASLNSNAVSTVTNIKNNQCGFYKPTGLNWTKNAVSGAVSVDKLNSYKLYDLYLLMPQEKDYSELEMVLNALNTNGYRNKFTIHAVVPCYTESSHYTSSNRLDLTERLNNLKTHISQLLTMDIDGICLKDLKGIADNDSNISDVTTALNTLVNHITNNLGEKYLMISAMVEPDVSKMNIHGQNYQTFANKCDYIIPILNAEGKDRTLPDINDTPLVVYNRSHSNIDYYQDCLEAIYNQSGKDNVFPLFYCGDSDDGVTDAEYDDIRKLYMVRGTWNYGVHRLHLQKSAIYTQFVLKGNGQMAMAMRSIIDKPVVSELLNEDDSNNMIETSAVITGEQWTKKTTSNNGVTNTYWEVSVSGNELTFNFKTAYGGKAGYEKPLCSLSLDGVSLKRKSDNATEFELSGVNNQIINLNDFILPVNSGTRTLELTIGESKSKRIKELRQQWQYHF